MHFRLLQLCRVLTFKDSYTIKQCMKVNIWISIKGTL